jgi:hypothetical protein
MEALWKKYGGSIQVAGSAVQLVDGSVQLVAVNTKTLPATDNQQNVEKWIDGTATQYVDPQSGITYTFNGIAGGVTFPVLHGPNIAGLYWAGGMYSYPLIYIIGADHRIKSIYSSGTLFTQVELEGHITDVVYARGPVDVEMVLDVSDSMNSLPAGVSAGDPKLTLLKQAANIALDIFVDHGQTDDRMGVVRFTDNASELEFGGKKLLSIAQHETHLRDEFAALSTGTCTAMGAGLQAAFDTLVSEGNQHRFAVLCTDGMQNIEPKVTEVSGHLEIIDSGGWLCGGHSSTPQHPGTDIKTYATRVHTIGIGLAASFEPLLQTIANETGGFYRATHDPQTDLDLIYEVDLCNCLASGSPAVVRHATGRLIAEKCRTEESFSVNRSARKLTVVLSWQKSDGCNLTFWLRSPDGTLLTLDREMKSFEDRCVASLYLPKEQGGKKIDHVGRWTMIIRGETPSSGHADYHMVAVVEDREIKCELYYPRGSYSVGDVFPLSIRLPETNKSKHRIVDLVVESSALRVSPGELIQNYRLSSHELERSAKVHLASRIHPGALLEAKLRRIESDPRMKILLQPERKRLSLRAGTLECFQKDREVFIPLQLAQAGVVSYKLEIVCESSESGPIERTKLVSVLVSAGPVDPKRSTVAVLKMEVKGESRLGLMITPRTERGEPLGPGLSQYFLVVKAKERLEVTITDLIDGTYWVDVLSAGGKHEVPVTVLFEGKTLWSGALS